LQQAASLAQFSNTIAEVADKFAQVHGCVVLSLGSGAFQSTPDLEPQTRSATIAANIPYPPFSAGFLANLLLLALGVVLTVLTIFPAGGDTGEAQARFSIQAIIAHCFEGTHDRRDGNSTNANYEEFGCNKSQKIRTDQGGWTYGT
jgi:hypothetical protein